MSIFHTGVVPFKKMTRVVPVFLTISNDYAPYAAVAIKSLMQKSDKKRYYRIIILHDHLSLANRFRLRNLVTKNCAIQFKKMSNSLYLKAITHYCSDKTATGDFFSSAVYYYRAFIARMFPQYEKAIYIDSDTVLLGDIGELFDLELGDNILAAMVDPKVEAIPEFREYVEKAVGVPYRDYVNSGVQLMNLKKLRKIRYLSTMIEMMDQYNANLVAPDQDYLNVILSGQILHLPSIWNAEPAKKMSPDTKLIHFNLFHKPWHYSGVDCEEIFWRAARGTGFYSDLKRQLENFSEEDKKCEEEKVAALIKKAGKLAKVKKPLLKLPEKGKRE